MDSKIEVGARERWPRPLWVELGPSTISPSAAKSSPSGVPRKAVTHAHFHRRHRSIFQIEHGSSNRLLTPTVDGHDQTFNTQRIALKRLAVATRNEKRNTMPKAYWVSAYRAVKDPDKFAAYAKLAGPALTAGGR